MKKILVVGDSYTYGSGCDDRPWYFDEKTNSWIPEKPKYPLPGPSEQCWASLLQSALPDCEVVNLALPGQDNGTILLSVLNYPDLANVDLIMFAGSGDDRYRIKSDVTQISVVKVETWVMANTRQGIDPAYNKALVEYIKYLYHPDVYLDNTIMTILALYGIAMKTNAKVLWNTLFWERSFKDNRLDPYKEDLFVSVSEFVRFRKSAQLGQLNPHYMSPCSHVNTRAHREYTYEYLLPFVKNKLGYSQ
jgi:hypothetical protein